MLYLVFLGGGCIKRTFQNESGSLMFKEAMLLTKEAIPFCLAISYRLSQDFSGNSKDIQVIATAIVAF